VAADGERHECPEQDERPGQLPNHGDYPTPAHYIVDGSDQDDAAWSFAFGLECALDGIATRLGL
jgi:hypothetical protein